MTQWAEMIVTEVVIIIKETMIALSTMTEEGTTKMEIGLTSNTTIMTMLIGMMTGAITLTEKSIVLNSDRREEDHIEAGEDTNLETKTIEVAIEDAVK